MGPPQRPMVAQPQSCDLESRGVEDTKNRELKAKQEADAKAAADKVAAELKAKEEAERLTASARAEAERLVNIAKAEAERLANELKELTIIQNEVITIVRQLNTLIDSFTKVPNLFKELKETSLKSFINQMTNISSVFNSIPSQFDKKLKF